jgi:two-component system response regulator WspF
MKIGIVTASAPLAETLRRAVALTEHQVAWSALDTAQALQLCAGRIPDLLLLDLALPDCIEATRTIMAQTPCAVLVVATDAPTNSSRVFQAMGYGAVDAIDAPPLDATNPHLAAAPFVAKLNGVARQIARQRKRDVEIRKGSLQRSQRLLAIGASAGGPAALAELLGGLPKDFPVAIAMVQHVDKQFAPNMAEWLNGFSGVPVRVAAEGDHPVAGTALLANTNDHLVFKAAERLGYTAHPRAQVYRPSVDVFFHSIDVHWAGTVVGVVLTGMGRDGALGLKALRNKGSYTIAQDKASCAVYGMPQAAIAAGAAVDVLPLSAIAARLIEYFSSAD